MQGYRTWWCSVWGAVTLLGTLVGFLVWPHAVVVVLFFLSAAFGAAGTTAYYRENPDRPIPGSNLARTSGAHGVVVGATTVAVIAVGALSGALLLLLVLAAAATSPWTVRAIGGGGWYPRQGAALPHENVRTESLATSMLERPVVSMRACQIFCVSDRSI